MFQNKDPSQCSLTESEIELITFKYVDENNAELTGTLASLIYTNENGYIEMNQAYYTESVTYNLELQATTSYG